MVGMLITLVFTLAMVGWGRWLLRLGTRGTRGHSASSGYREDGPLEYHPAAEFGISGMIGLGSVGLLTLFIGLVPGGLKWGIAVVALLGVFGAVQLVRDRPRIFGRRPEGPEWVAVAGLLLPLVVGIVGTLAPSTALDWDTIAYHLAVPKMWLQAGQIHPVTFIHHSNFPFTVDNLYLWGLVWGGQAGAKAFTLGFTLLGIVTIFGLARQAWGPRAGLLAAAAFATAPVIVWETGSGYLDVAHGLYAGVGAYLLLRTITHREPWLPGALMMAFAIGTKYTGLQSAIAVALVGVVLAMRVPHRGEALKAMSLSALAILLVGGPWYVKNTLWTGNPVYPFFYERLGGKNWDQKQADVYRNEQKTFGVPNEGPLSLPHSVLGMAYQPGRYINPGQTLVVDDRGQASGATGNPLGAIGMALMVGLFMGALGTRRRELAPAMVWLAVCLLMWAMLSQQSRYATSFAPVLALALGAWAVSPKRTVIVAGLIAVQGMVTGYWAKQMLLDPDRVRVVLGATSPDEYLRAKLGFYEAAQAINSSPSKVALYDEVFGFYLDVPYVWASYGHSTEMGYAEMTSADDLIASFERQGIERVYVNLRMSDPEFVRRWVGAMGLGDQPAPLPDDERNNLIGDVQARWKVFLADAVAQGKLRPTQVFRGGVLFDVVKS